MAAPLFVKAFSSLFLGFGKSAQAAKSFSQAGAMAAGQFSRGLSSNLVKGVNAAQLGKNIGADLNKGFAAAFKDVAYKRSTEMWGRTSAAMLYGGTGARATAAGNALKIYGGSAETYSQTMMGLQARLTGLKYGQTGWLVEAMQKSGGRLKIRGSGENGFATGEELIRNLAQIKDQIPVGQFTAVANALGLSADIQKSILANDLSFIDKANYLTESQQKSLDELGKKQLETAAVWKKVADVWGANTAPFWTGWEKFKADIGEGFVSVLQGKGFDADEDLKGKNEEEAVKSLMQSARHANQYAGKYAEDADMQGKMLEYIRQKHLKGDNIESMGEAEAAYAILTGKKGAQAAANVRAYIAAEGKYGAENATITDRDKAAGAAIEEDILYTTGQYNAWLKGIGVRGGDINVANKRNEKMRKLYAEAMDRVNKGYPLSQEMIEAFEMDASGYGGIGDGSVKKNPYITAATAAAAPLSPLLFSFINSFINRGDHFTGKDPRDIQAFLFEQGKRYAVEGQDILKLKKERDRVGGIMGIDLTTPRFGLPDQNSKNVPKPSDKPVEQQAAWQAQYSAAAAEAAAKKHSIPQPSDKPVDQQAAWQAQASAAAAEAAQRNSNLTVDVNNKDMNVNVHVDGTLNGVGSTIVTEMKEGLKQRDESFNDTFGVLGSQHLRDYILSGSGK